MDQAGNSYRYQKEFKRAQLRINEIRELKEKDLLETLSTSQLTILQPKKKSF